MRTLDAKRILPRFNVPPLTVIAWLPAIDPVPVRASTPPTTLVLPV